MMILNYVVSVAVTDESLLTTKQCVSLSFQTCDEEEFIIAIRFVMVSEIINAFIVH